MGLQKYQSKMYSSLMEDKYNDITGRLMCKVMQSLKARPESKLKDSIKGIQIQFNKSQQLIKSAIQSVKKLWRANTLTESNGNLLNSLKNMFSSDSKINNKVASQTSALKIKNQLQSCSIRNLWIDDKQIYPIPQKIQIKNITALSLDRFSAKCAEILGTSCLKLTYLNIGSNIQKSNVDDDCCKAIGYYLKHVNHLFISHSPLTDKGATFIAQEIPRLKTLHLRFNNNMTVAGKEKISQMLENCQFR